MYFSSEEILSSVISAILFGGAFAFFCVLASNVFRQAVALIISGRQIFSYVGIFDVPRLEYEYRASKTGLLSQMFAFFFTVLFGVLFILLSYYSLDGSLRIYMFLIFGSAFLAIYLTLNKYLTQIFDAIFSFIFKALVYAIRLVFLPTRCFFTKIFPKIVKNVTNLFIKMGRKLHFALDKGKN